MSKYEYVYIKIPKNRKISEKILNDFGNEGWKLHSTAPSSYYVLEREKQDIVPVVKNINIAEQSQQGRILHNNKYRLTDETKDYNGVTLYRIQAIKDFDTIKAGDFGGWVEKEANLSQEGYCWIFDNAMVYGNARVFDNAWVAVNARVFGKATLFDNAYVYDNANVFGKAIIFDNARVSGDASVYDYATLYSNAKVSGNDEVYSNEIRN